MKKHKMVLLICGLALVVVAALLYVQWRDTDDLMRYAESVLEGEVPYEDTEGTPIGSYNWTYEGNLFEGEYVEVDINRRFVLHNFSDGYIWLNYNNHVFDKSNKSHRGDSGPISSLWKIHKTENGWEIVDIIERP